jgi:hypothetical protein
MPIEQVIDKVNLLAQVENELQRRLSYGAKPKVFSEQCLPIGRIECVDGTILSVQASYGHYCSPRSNHGPYTEVEIGYPSIPILECIDYAESKEHLTDTVYAYVPISLVAEFIANHGGFA